MHQQGPNFDGPEGRTIDKNVAGNPTVLTPGLPIPSWHWWCSSSLGVSKQTDNCRLGARHNPCPRGTWLSLLARAYWYECGMKRMSVLYRNCSISSWTCLDFSWALMLVHHWSCILIQSYVKKAQKKKVFVVVLNILQHALFCSYPVTLIYLGNNALDALLLHDDLTAILH